MSFPDAKDLGLIHSLSTGDLSADAAAAAANASKDSTAHGESNDSVSRKRTSPPPVKTKTSTPVSKRKKKPKGMPKRPLSAYNLYFKAEREKMLAAAENGQIKIGFEGMGKIVGKKWKELSPVDVKVYERKAQEDSERYRLEMDVYNQMKAKKLQQLSSASTNSRDLNQSPSPTRNPDASQTSQYNSPLASHQGQIGVARAQVTNSLPPAHPNLAQSSSFGSDTRVSYPEGFNSHLPHYPHNSAPRAYSQPFQQVFHSPPSFQAPPPFHSASMPSSGSFPVPPGMEIVLTDKSGKDCKYFVEYKCYEMTQDAARRYLESMTKVAADNGPPPPVAAPPPSYPSQQTRPQHQNLLVPAASSSSASHPTTLGVSNQPPQPPFHGNWVGI